MRAVLFLAFLVALAAIGLALFLFLRGGAFGQEEEFAPEMMRELRKEGVSARLLVDPEVGVRPGDLLSISLLVAFDPNRAEVDQNQILEDYLEFKKKALETCEEYVPPEVRDGTRKGFSWFSFTFVFQCWVVDEAMLYLSPDVFYTGKDGSSGSMYLAKYVTFTTIPIRSGYKAMIESVVVHRGPGARLLAGGASLLSLGFLVLGYMWFRARKKKSTGFTAKPPRDYFLESIEWLSGLVEILEPGIVADKLYHLCLQYALEREAGEQEIAARQLESLKNELRRLYEVESIGKDEIVRYLSALKEIAKKGGSQT